MGPFFVWLVLVFGFFVLFTEPIWDLKERANPWESL